MPLFYFDIYDQDGYHPDCVGDEFEDIDEVRDQVRALLPDIARWRCPDGPEESIACCVRDAGGEPVYRGELIFRGTMLKTGASRPPINVLMLR